MKEDETIHGRIAQLVNEFGKGKNTVFASRIGSNEANVRGYKTSVMPKFDFLEKIARNIEVNLDWLLTGRGSMLLNNQSQPVSQLQPDTTSTDPTQIVQMFMNKLDEKDAKIDEKENDNKRLHSELLSMTEELASTKAQLSKYQSLPQSHFEGLDSGEVATVAVIKQRSLTSEPSASYVISQ